MGCIDDARGIDKTPDDPGFIVSDFARVTPISCATCRVVREGKVKHREFVSEGLDSAPGAFMGF